jgi:SM-20-related protein
MNAAMPGPGAGDTVLPASLPPPKFLIFDDFLPAALHAGLLDFALTNQGAFAPTQVVRDGTSRVDTETRLSSECSDGLGPHRTAFKQAIHALQNDMVSGLGLAPFDLASTELNLVAHGDNAFYKPHIDTLVGVIADSKKSVRVVSCVYYFHREPKRFSGGEIALYSFGRDPKTEVIAPVQNRLLVFPSFARHEVLKVSSPSGEFADSRFAINCWLHKGAQAAYARK